MNNIILPILEYFKNYEMDFDVYVVADTQNRTKNLYDFEFLHADETEFFSKDEFAEIASAIFYVFGYVRVFYSEIEFIEYFLRNNLNSNKFVVYNFSRDGRANGKKSLIPAFCDLLKIRYTGSNAFVISLLRNKDVYTTLLEANNIAVPKSVVYNMGTETNEINKVFGDCKIIVKNLHESASIGLTNQNVFNVSNNTAKILEKLSQRMQSQSLFIQEYIDGPEFEVLVVQFKGKYYSLMPIEIILPNSHTYINTEISNSYQYEFRIAQPEHVALLCNAATKAASILNIKDYARFDFRIRNGIPYLFDIAGTPYTIHHSSIAYLFMNYYNLPYESIYKVITSCMLSNYDLNDYK